MFVCESGCGGWRAGVGVEVAEVVTPLLKIFPGIESVRNRYAGHSTLGRYTRVHWLSKPQRWEI